MDNDYRSPGGFNFAATFILLVLLLFLAFITSVDGLLDGGTPSAGRDGAVVPNNGPGLGIGGGDDSLGTDTYTVKRSDTLSAIAKRFDTTVAALVEANPGVQNPSLIYPDQVLNIPAPVVALEDTSAVPDPPLQVASPILPDTGGVPQASSLTGITVPDNPRLYLIAINGASIGGESIACGDTLVPVSVDASQAGSPLAGVLNALLSLEGSSPSAGLYNALHRSSLALENVEVSGQHARIHLTGEIAIDGVCDAARIQAQLEQTALQFDDIETVDILVNGRPLNEALSPGGPLVYIVQPGDSLRSIALRFGITESTLLQANPQIDPDVPLPAGSILNVPEFILRPTPQDAYRVYIVVPGDTIGEIADRYGVTVEAIRAANPQIVDITRLHPGQSLRIP